MDTDATTVVEQALAALIAGEVEVFLSYIADDVRILRDRGADPPFLCFTGKLEYRRRLAALPFGPWSSRSLDQSFEITTTVGPDEDMTTWVQAQIHIKTGHGNVARLRAVTVTYHTSLSELLRGWVQRAVGRRYERPQPSLDWPDEFMDSTTSDACFAVRGSKIHAIMARGWPLLPWRLPRSFTT